MNTATFDYTGANVLVTGASSGIGHAIATAFADAGAKVIGTGTRPGVEDYPDTDLRAITYRQCHLADPDSIAALVESLGELDILINNAGGPYPTRKDEWTPEGYVDSVTANMFGPARITLGCHELLKASTAPGGASVVSIVSMSAFRAAASVPGYGSSKAGLVSFTMDLANRWAADGIRVNTVAPGFIDTRLTHPALGIPQVMDFEVGFHTPLNRPGTAQDCVGAVLFLCSASASYITGTSVPVDGGYLTV